METKEEKSNSNNVQSDKKNSVNENRSIGQQIVSLLTAFFILSSSIIIIYLVLDAAIIQLNIPEKYFAKNVKDKIELAIKNKADLDVVKHIYNTREIKSKGIYIPFITKIENIYAESTSLSSILYDIKTEYFLNKIKDSVFLNGLENLINENEEINPFDKLVPNQRFMFENVRQKLDSNYVVVKDDLNRIADELSSKNILVTEYLGKSNVSYWISIIALGLTIILSIIQIIQNYNRKGSKGKSKIAKAFNVLFNSRDDIKEETNIEQHEKTDA